MESSLTCHWARDLRSKMYGFSVREHLYVFLQNMRPETDAEALANSVRNGEPVVPETVVRGAQSFEDAREAPLEAEEGQPEHQEAAGALDEDVEDMPPFSSILEEETAPADTERRGTVREAPLGRPERNT